MPALSRRQRAALVIALGSSAIVGCLVVTPLDDLPSAHGGTASNGGSSNGGSSHGGSSDAGAAPNATAGDGGRTTTKPASGGDSSGGPCQTNAECVRGNADEPARCRASDHTCVALRSDTCSVVLGADSAADPNAIVFGGFAPINPNAPTQGAIVLSHQLALQELSGDNVGGLPGGENGQRRPLVMLVCSNADADVETGLDHLIDDVEVPAVIANLKPGDLRKGYEKHLERDVLFLSPIAVTRPVVIEPDHDLIWNLLGQPSDLAPTYTALLKRYETFLRGVRNLQPSDHIRVDLVTTTDAFDSELGDAVEPFLRFNGQDTTANARDGNYQPFLLDPANPQLDKVAVSIVADRPDIIVSTASELLTKPGGLLQQIEMEWGDGALNGTEAQRRNRPFYILSPYNEGDLGATSKLIADFVEGNETRANERFIGISIAGAADTTLQRAYETRLRKLVKTPYVDTANYYDATYFLAYAMFGSGDQQLTGSGIARGMKRLLSGTKFNIGPDPIGDIFNTLTTPTATIDLQSTLGPPSFDPNNGVRRVTGGVYCFDKAGTTEFDVLRYDPAKQDVTGPPFPCFSGIYP